MQRAAGSEPQGGAAAHPLAELLSCPPTVANLLNASARSITFAAGDIVFRQSEGCRGLYVILSGQLLRRAERMETKLTLGSVRAGELLELAAVLGDSRHTYTLIAQTPGSVMFLPLQALYRAFEAYPPLRMSLLEELAREVSRVYSTCCTTRRAAVRHRAPRTLAGPQAGS
jgi:CRP-like cAMP-binding protein